MTSRGSGTDGLVEPARQQVLIIADAVLGALPAEEVPAALRPVARFTPSKRLRLGATALAAALDTDPEFRERVAATAADGAPELAAVVRDGAVGDHLAADPLDVAVLAYLLRPAGWEQVAAAAGARWRADHGAGRDPDALDRLRAEVAELRAAAKGETGRLRDATAAATAAAEEELTTLRRVVRDRTRELRAAERERDTAQAARDVAEGRLTDQADAHRTELRRIEGRAAEAGRAASAASRAAAEAARRDNRLERDVDEARLWLLVDTLVQAAAGVRRELSLAAPDVRPADTVAAAEVPGAGRGIADIATLDGVLALPHVHVVVDGYNVTKTGYPELALADQRARLVAALAALAGRTGAEVTVAWDGAARPPVQPPAPRGVRVLFSAADEIADDLIRRLVAAEPDGRPVLVVTSDQQIVRDTARAGVWSAPSVVLLERLA